jgi:hypothetical protein
VGRGTQIGDLLQQRQAEGYVLKPILIETATKEESIEMEELLIEMIGRECDGTGLLFNKSKGGQGPKGFSPSAETKKKIGQKSKGRRHMRYLGWIKSKRCTVDGVRIFDSVIELRQTLGQGKTGTRSPTFRYVEKEVQQ